MDDFSDELANVSFSNTDGKVGNQVLRQTVHGNQYYYQSRDEQASAFTRRCVSVPHSTSSAYIARPSLLQQLSQKLQTPVGRKSRRTVTVTGLGGSGKTQLVLDHLEEHENEYSAILWIDATDETTIRASYLDCAQALGLRFVSAAGPSRLQDDAAVKAVLQWLSRADQRWLVVLDNANDLDIVPWNVNTVIPRGRVGAVVLISRDHHAYKMLGQGWSSVKVDSMETDQAVQLLCTLIDREPEAQAADTREAMTQLVTSLDKLPLGIEAIASQIKDDLDHGHDLLSVLHRYRDYFCRSINEHQSGTGPLLEAISMSLSSAWDTSFAALQRFESSQPTLQPLTLLGCLSYFDTDSVHDEVFRIARMNQSDFTRFLNLSNLTLPQWLSEILGAEQAGSWDETCYRATIHELERYSLLRRVDGIWSKVVMKSLIKRRAREIDGARDFLELNFTLVGMCCNFESIYSVWNFKDHLMTYVPDQEWLKRTGLRVDTKFKANLCMLIGSAWNKLGQPERGVELTLLAMKYLESALGRKNKASLAAVYNLCTLYLAVSSFEKSEQLLLETLPMFEEIFGQQHETTIQAMFLLAASHFNCGNLDKAKDVGEQVCRLRHEVSGDKAMATLESMYWLSRTYLKLNDHRAAAEFGSQTLLLLQEVHGNHSNEAINTMRVLADAYRGLQELAKEEEVLKAPLAIEKRKLGPTAAETLLTMTHLAEIYLMQDKQLDWANIIRERAAYETVMKELEERL